MRRRVVVALLLALLAPAPASSGVPGALDGTFSGDGWTTTDWIEEDRLLPEGAVDLAVQQDGRILAVGELVQDGPQGWAFGVLRYTANGGLDQSFGRGGWALSPKPGSDSAHAVAVQRNGRILVAGEGTCGFVRCEIIARFLPDGRPDRSFGGDGVIAPYTYCCDIAALAVQGNGRIVAVGSRARGRYAQDMYRFLIARFLPDGRRDRSFSGDGWATVDFGLGNALAEDVEILRSGKLVVAGQGGRDILPRSDFAVARLLPNGRLDQGFSADGKQAVDFGRHYDIAHALDVAPNGKIVLAGHSAELHFEQPRMALLRLKKNGGLDPTFGNGGKLRLRPLPGGGDALALVRQANGRIVVGGPGYVDSAVDVSDWVLARYTAGGRPDRSFGGDGVVVANLSGGTDWIGDLALRHGRLLAAGQINGSQAVARFLLE